MPFSIRLSRCLVIATALTFGLAIGIRAQTPVPQRPSDLAEVAGDAPTAIANLYRALAHPADRVQLAGGDVVVIEPLGTDSLLNPDFAGNINAQKIADADQIAGPVVLTQPGIALYAPYERLAFERIAEFEKADGDLTALERLTALETAVAVVLRYSFSARERPLKGPSRWESLQAELNSKLLLIRRNLLRLRTAAARGDREWQAVLRQGDDLVAEFPGNTALLTDLASQRTRYAAALLMDMTAGKQSLQDYAKIRRQLEWVDEHFLKPPRLDPLEAVNDLLLQLGRPVVMLYSPDADALRQLLTAKATALWNEAKRTKDKAAALDLLQNALKIWPRLPGLRDEVLQRQGRYGIVYVGVRSLPKYLSPARAAADSELQALELLFESLVEARPGEDGSLGFVPQLASSLPQRVDSERRFLLKKAAYWSNGTRLTSADLQRTYELLTSAKLLGNSAELADQVEPMRAGDDPFRIDGKLKQGLLEPLAPFTFKALPREHQGTTLAAADDEAFALRPIGSGRFMLAPPKSEHGRNYVRFVVNPYFVPRNPPAENQSPEIREVRFFVSTDAALDLAHKEAPADLFLDVPAPGLAKLKAAGKIDLRTLATRRVWFLAVNHREAVLGDEALRRALAHGIDRNQVLADCFGDGHHPLNGPYPANSWALSSDNRVPAKLFDRALAEKFLKSAKNNEFSLELKYPDDDPRIAEACAMIKDQLADLGERAGRPMVLRLVALPPHQLQRDLQMHRYQLAYWHYDFPDDTYSLWPLFDPRPQAIATGSNYLGYKEDSILSELLQKAGSYRDFSEVQRLTHLVHDALYEHMPLVPLWQLNYHLAVHPRLQLPRVDPLRVFSTIDEWHMRGN